MLGCPSNSYFKIMEKTQNRCVKDYKPTLKCLKVPVGIVDLSGSESNHPDTA